MPSCIIPIHHPLSFAFTYHYSLSFSPHASSLLPFVRFLPLIPSHSSSHSCTSHLASLHFWRNRRAPPAQYPSRLTAIRSPVSSPSRPPIPFAGSLSHYHALVFAGWQRPIPPHLLALSRFSRHRDHCLVLSLTFVLARSLTQSSRALFIFIPFSRPHTRSFSRSPSFTPVLSHIFLRVPSFSRNLSHLILLCPFL